MGKFGRKQFRYGIYSTIITQQLIINKDNVDFSQDKLEVHVVICMEAYLNDEDINASNK